MPYFADAGEVFRYIGGAFRLANDQPEAGPKLRAADMVLRYEFHEPSATLTLVLREPAIEVFEGDSGVVPDVTMRMSADDGDKFWRGKLNAAVALARGQVKVEGAVAKVLKLIPAAKPVYPLYEQLTAEKDAASPSA
ncbi:SCP2 sterol-binding domain-containing protein [Mycobacterium sp. CBMA226]|nr:SCP2 sterol-binding domain-containing protein [Mycolicibacterium sp. CBMA 226]